MNQLEQYFNDFKIKRGISRDDHAAEALGISPSILSRAKKQGYITDEICLKLAREIDIHPALVFLARETVKEKNGRIASVWNDAFSAARQLLQTDNKDYRKLLQALRPRSFNQFFQQLILHTFNFFPLFRVIN